MTPTACKQSAATVIEHALRCLPALPAVRQSAKNAADRFSQGVEPPLSELLDDPILGRLMRRDGVDMDDLLVLIADVRKALARR